MPISTANNLWFMPGERQFKKKKDNFKLCLYEVLKSIETEFDCRLLCRAVFELMLSI